MQHLKVSGAVRPLKWSLGVKWLNKYATWSFTLREERRVKVLENRVLMRLFGSKRGEVTGDWRKLHSKKLCYSGHQFKKNEMGGACSPR